MRTTSWRMHHPPCLLTARSLVKVTHLTLHPLVSQYPLPIRLHIKCSAASICIAIIQHRQLRFFYFSPTWHQQLTSMTLASAQDLCIDISTHFHQQGSRLELVGLLCTCKSASAFATEAVPRKTSTMLETFQAMSNLVSRAFSQNSSDCSSLYSFMATSSFSVVSFCM